MNGAALGTQPFIVLRAAQLDQTPPEQRWLIASLGADAGGGLEAIGRIRRITKGWGRATPAQGRVGQ